jgi:hypothetical protein
LIAYLSDDEVNRDLATRLAAACGVALQLFSPKETPPDDLFDAVLYDLETMPPKRRAEIVAALLAAPSTRPVAIHAYNLDVEANTLKENGVIVSRRLGPAVLRALSRPLGSAPTSQLPIETRGELAASYLIGEVTVSPLGVARRDW